MATLRLLFLACIACLAVGEASVDRDQPLWHAAYRAARRALSKVPEPAADPAGVTGVAARLAQLLLSEQAAAGALDGSVSLLETRGEMRGFDVPEGTGAFNPRTGSTAPNEACAKKQVESAECIAKPAVKKE